MLPDLERKILRILYNYLGQRRRMPSMHELEVKTGQNKSRIHQALLLLESEDYIAWENKANLEDIQILEGWEREADLPKPVLTHGTVDYWTKY